MTVYFIGAGPGDPDLITIKAQRLIDRCPVILYAGSLVPRQLFAGVEDRAEAIMDTASMCLDEIIEHIEAAHAAGKDVARVHSGDPSVYGAIGEQIRRLQPLGIDFEIIPGVTATSASAAWLGKELTLSGITQTIIMTRYEGKTPFPERERLPALAAIGATLAIHLGVTRIHKIVEELIPHYGHDCPIAVCYRTGWPDQDKVIGTLDDIVEKVRAKKFTRTSLILVGRAMAAEGFQDSYLYDDQQAHVYRPKFKPAVKRNVDSALAHPKTKNQ
ncbi:precorrin-4 C(11)-methyltransferase [Ketobacter sp. MCCC 1A13808]|uniref:precorrin-4 C(11)-methyltransferase n=1 Tax=Ketobacter sp. MCCC 1A13808 TaxID=2602738 RepID=UPI000F18B5CA|nr:precorrin-4 C(11)-methyltransferase [Ketobacter sp. MCCC 1A13808]MVF13629.1 precorrin-4 C(11)-methyltransferase [Ketobacter sp. MCCC 1A13808]RLP53128.1 MAG: precorrin-4 C(11)-methyltransferase [Ketobacter sp.]